MEKKLKCAEIDLSGSGTRDHLVKLEIRLEERDGHQCFALCGEVIDPKGRMVMGGQCLDEIFAFKEMDPWRTLYGIWRDWHCNDLTPGSPKQEEAVRKWRERRRKAGTWHGGCDYDEACKMLEKKGLLVDRTFKYNGKPYKYGTAWLTRDIPEDTIKTIRAFMAGEEPK